MCSEGANIYFGSDRWGKSVTWVILWLMKALEAQVYLKHFCHQCERYWTSLRAMEIFRYEPKFLTSFQWNLVSPWCVEANTYFNFKGRILWQNLVLSLLVSYAFLKNAMWINLWVTLRWVIVNDEKRWKSTILN